MHRGETPRVSVGLAVYNGDNYLEEALTSILGQTFGDFELIISDNASTDATPDICLKYAHLDSRIRYHRNEKNIGGANNENLTFRMARGEYFRWAGHDDVCAPELLARCVEVLDRDAEVVLCHTVVIDIDEKGNYLRTIDRHKASSSKPHIRFRDLIALDYNCEESYGVIRAHILGRTGLQRNYTDSDRTLLAHLSLFGRFHQVPEPLFYHRVHPKMSTWVFPDWRGRMAWFIPDIGDGVVMPSWQQFLHYLEIITTSPLSPFERLQCYRHLVGWLILERHGRWMGKDALLAIAKVLRRPVTRLSAR